jgi:hypothetical protein
MANDEFECQNCAINAVSQRMLADALMFACQKAGGEIIVPAFKDGARPNMEVKVLAGGIISVKTISSLPGLVSLPCVDSKETSIRIEFPHDYTGAR